MQMPAGALPLAVLDPGRALHLDQVLEPEHADDADVRGHGRCVLVRIELAAGRVQVVVDRDAEGLLDLGSRAADEREVAEPAGVVELEAVAGRVAAHRGHVRRRRAEARLELVGREPALVVRARRIGERALEGRDRRVVVLEHDHGLHLLAGRHRAEVGVGAEARHDVVREHGRRRARAARDRRRRRARCDARCDAAQHDRDGERGRSDQHPSGRDPHRSPWSWFH